ncbi:MAG: hypothetical protein QG608_1639 [Actinomycetota bacterium]|nr:hypothetical protein [Actinomycetota bacterium]
MRTTKSSRGGDDLPAWNLPEAVVRQVAVSAFDNRCYLLTCKSTGEQLLVDAADDARRIMGMVAEGGDGLSWIVTTHCHKDHFQALAELLGATGACSAAGRPDAEALPVFPDLLLDHGDELRIGALTLQVVHLRGHTPGSLALVLRSGSGQCVAFTGDSLFPGGVGNTGGSPERFTTLFQDVQDRLFGVLPDDTLVLPGHGKHTTLGAERPHLAQWRARGW